MTKTNATAPTPLPALSLRTRDAEWVDRPQTLADFARPARLPKTQRCAGLTEALVADAIARTHYEIDQLAGDRVVVSCETPRYGIPVGVLELDRAPVEDWLHRDVLSGELLNIDAAGRIERSVAMQVRRGLIAVAGALPLVLGPTLAHASGPSATMGHLALDELVAFAPPAKAAPAPTTTEAPSAPDGSSPDATEAPTAEDPAAAQPTTEPAPRVDGGNLTLAGRNLWDGLLGQQVRLEMKSGASVAGMLVAQSGGELAIARSPDGTVVSVPKAEVASVGIRPSSVVAESIGGASGSSVPPHMRPTKDGRGLQAGGVVMITVGSIATLSGTVLLAIFPSPYYLFMSLPLLLPGLSLIGGGAGMLVSAGKKRKAFNQAWGIPPTARLQITPTIGAGRSGGQAGLVLRF